MAHVQVNIPAFLEVAALAARQVGVMARRLQGQVANEGKAVDGLAHLDAHIQRMHVAKTAVDEIAQDILITALAPLLPQSNTLLDGEEETPGKALLPADKGDYVLVIDPIDGTLIYTEGGDGYSTNTALLHKGQLAAALLYYPALDVAYWTDGQSAYRAYDFAVCGMAKAERLSLPQQVNSKEIFVYWAVDAAVKAEITAAGYTIRRSFQPARGADPVATLFDGQIGAAVLHGIQVRDIVHGAIFTCAGAELRDWAAQPVEWPLQGGALGKVTVAAGPLDPLLAAILRKHAT